MNKKVRIIKRTYPDKRISFVIQVKDGLFFWMWIDASLRYEYDQDEFSSLKKAKKNLCYFDGSKCTEEIIKI